MTDTIAELVSTITVFTEKISLLTEDEFGNKPDALKWSKKEVLGHLIDSAQNNLRRFIVAQYEAEPHIVYDQDFWVKANGYQQMKKDDVIALWKLINLRIAAVLTSMPVDKQKRQANTGKVQPELHSLEWLASDYLRHMKHHLNQIFPKSFDIVYP